MTNYIPLKSGSYSRSVLLYMTFAVLLLLNACKPAIYSFTVDPLTIGTDDSVRVNWKVRGEATLLIHDQRLSGLDSNCRLRELTLVVRENNKEISRKIQVAVLPDGTSDQIVFPTSLQGDTLLAAGTNNPLRWGDAFVIRSIQNITGRSLIISHDERIIRLDPGSGPDTSLAGSPVKGNWAFRSMLSAAEKADHHLLPDRLCIRITVQHH